MAEDAVVVEEENLANISLNETFDPNETFYFALQHYWWDVPVFIAIIAGLVVNIITVRAALPLRSRRQMRFLVAWIICYIAATILSPILFNSFGALEGYIRADVECWWLQYLIISSGGVQLFTIVIAIDWYGSWHYSSICRQRCHRYAAIIVVVLVFKLCLLVTLSTVTCIHGFFFHLSILASFYLHITAFLCVAIVNIMHKVRWCCRKVSQHQQVPEVVDEAVMWVINVYVLCWLPHALMIYVSFLTMHHLKAWVYVFCNVLGFMSPIFGIWILYKRDGEFRQQLTTLLGCGWKDTSPGSNHVSDLETPFMALIPSSNLI